MWPWMRFWLFQAVSPWRTRQRRVDVVFAMGAFYRPAPGHPDSGHATSMEFCTG